MGERSNKSRANLKSDGNKLMHIRVHHDMIAAPLQKVGEHLAERTLKLHIHLHGHGFDDGHELSEMFLVTTASDAICYPLLERLDSSPELHVARGAQSQINTF